MSIGYRCPGPGLADGELPWTGIVLHKRELAAAFAIRQQARIDAALEAVRVGDGHCPLIADSSAWSTVAYWQLTHEAARWLPVVPPPHKSAEMSAWVFARAEDEARALAAPARKAAAEAAALAAHRAASHPFAALSALRRTA